MNQRRGLLIGGFFLVFLATSACSDSIEGIQGKDSMDEAAQGDGPGSRQACESGAADYLAAGATMRASFSSTVGRVKDWKIGGRFPEAVPDFLRGRPDEEPVYVCYVDGELATRTAQDAPPHDRAIVVVDSDGESALFVAGYTSDRGDQELPVESPPASSD